MKLRDEGAPGQMVVAAVPVTRQIWPGALDADRLAILARAPETLLTPVAQVLPRFRSFKMARVSMRSGFSMCPTVTPRLPMSHGRWAKAPVHTYKAQMPARGIEHVDLTVSDVERSGPVDRFETAS